MSFEIQSLEHLVNIVVKNLRGSRNYNIPKERLREELEWCWLHRVTDDISNKAEYFGVYDPVNTVTWDSKVFIGGSVNDFISKIRSLKEDYEIFYEKLRTSEDLENEWLDLSEVPQRILKRKKLAPLDISRHCSDEYSREFEALVEELVGACGNYFLYDKHGELIYIGRSINLGMRIASSVVERRADKVEVAITETQSDATVYEMYYISKCKPNLNVDANYPDALTIELPCIRNYDVVEIYST